MKIGLPKIKTRPSKMKSPLPTIGQGTGESSKNFDAEKYIVDELQSKWTQVEIILDKLEDEHNKSEAQNKLMREWIEVNCPGKDINIILDCDSKK